MLLELVEGGEEAGPGLGHAHSLGHVPLMDDDCGSAVAEVVERAGGVHPGSRLDPGESFGRDDLGEGGDHPVAAVLA